VANSIVSPGRGETEAEGSAMPQSFVCLYCHVIFSTKNHEPFLMSKWRPRLHAYIGGILRSKLDELLAAGGTADHLHLLVSLGKQSTVSDTIRDVKSNSSRWIHETFSNLRGFAWQTGYGAFTVSRSSLGDVRRYIANQEQHHRVRTFQEEYVAFLKRHGIQYDERYIWD
jgi:putative transposase